MPQSQATVLELYSISIAWPTASSRYKCCSTSFSEMPFCLLCNTLKQYLEVTQIMKMISLMIPTKRTGHFQCNLFYLVCIISKITISICRVLIATKANKTKRFIRSSALLDTKSTHSLYARSHCSVPVCPARTTAVRYALLLIQPLYTTFSLFLRTYT